MESFYVSGIYWDLWVVNFLMSLLPERSISPLGKASHVTFHLSSPSFLPLCHDALEPWRCLSKANSCVTMVQKQSLIPRVLWGTSSFAKGSFFLGQMVTETVVISWRAHKCFIGTPYLFKNNSSYFPFGAYEILNHRLLYLFNETFSQGISILVCFSIAMR